MMGRSAGSMMGARILIGSGTLIPAVNNTLASTSAIASTISGFATLANLLDARLTAAGV